MNVLLVSWEHPPRLFGGLGRHVEGLAGALPGLGWHVTVLTPHLDVVEPPSPEGLTVLRGATPLVALPADEWVAGVLEANLAMVQRADAADLAPDVIHVHDWMAAPAGLLLAQMLKVPLVATIHATERGRHQGHLPPGISGWINAQEQGLVDAAEVVVVCSSAMAQAVSSTFATVEPTIIGNGVDPARWQRNRPRDPDLIVIAGRLEYEKGVHLAMQATRGLGVRLVVAGTGTQAGWLADQAEDHVTFVGRLPQGQLADLLSTAAIALIPSLYEPFGLAALEAMAAGAAVVASDVGGLREIVPHGAGLRVPPDDVPALRAALEGLLDDPDRQRRLAATALTTVTARSWTETARRYAEIYASVSAG